jgi:hypothetical protein
MKYNVLTNPTNHKVTEDIKHLWVVKLLGYHKLYPPTNNKWFTNSGYPVSKVIFDIMDVNGKF